MDKSLGGYLENIQNDLERELMVIYGWSMVRIQNLEVQYSQLITADRYDNGLIENGKRFRRIMNKYASKSMGELFTETQRRIKFSEEELIVLKEVLKVRNYIVHNLFKDHLDKTYTIAGLIWLTQHLNFYNEKLDACKNILSIRHDEIMRKNGISEVGIEEYANEIVMDAIKNYRSIKFKGDEILNLL